MNPIDAPTRYRLFKKGAYGTFYIEDVLTRRQTSLKTNATRRMSKPQFIWTTRCDVVSGVASRNARLDPNDSDSSTLQGIPAGF